MSSPSIIHAKRLVEVSVKALTAVGVKIDEAHIVADHLVDANLTGYHSHGIARLPIYVEGIKKGLMVSGVSPEVVKESAATALLDCKFLLGPVAVENAFQMAAKKASEAGIGCVSTLNATYAARLGLYVEQVASNGKIAIMTANDGGSFPAVAPWNSVQAFLSTNPIAAGIPRGPDIAPIIIDIATASTARGKLNLKYQAGEKDAPPGILIGKDGKEESSLSAFFQDSSAAILPLGGFIAGHKGFALSLLVDVLSGALGGTGCSSGKMTGKENSGVFCLVINPEFFGTREQFVNHVEKLIAGIKSCPPVPGQNEILIPGERLSRARKETLETGILLSPEDWKIVNKYS